MYSCGQKKNVNPGNYDLKNGCKNTINLHFDLQLKNMDK